ncbi:hypothetical protein LTR36_009178 [Oleoguttula mirabilis]|uniref:Peptidase S33 tripeptidyl aminopeptidase-like C-terminal domain-containing protein n=1 Tax=Oleoguttula mirabilis TaxID=1507867 RepID=A0AAV9J621_9PEZI|nr:hypothetical protein LTR36_009178 [Oleoguttula mirabilis]
MYLGGLTNFFLQSSSRLQDQTPLVSSAAKTKLGFLWDEVAPAKQLEWHPCFREFQCARLQVPMDWQGTSTEADRTVELAVIKVEATVPVTHPSYGGAVVLNPGGPGGSGIGQVLRGGYSVRTILSAGPGADSETAKHFDIISFDPRGVNNTRPMLTCFPNHLEAAAYSLVEQAYGMIDSSDTSFDNLWAGKRAVAEGCSKRAAEEGIGKHMSTAPVARDIVEIFERHGEWREKEGQRLLRSMFKAPSDEKEAIVTRTAYRPGKEMVQYWGISYGTILGATLSAMFPERVHRAVLDGVADSHDYMAGGWTTNLQDTDMTFAKLAEYCYDGGMQNCAIWHEDGPAVIAINVATTISHLREHPVSVPGDETHGPALVTYDDLKTLIREIVYKPLLEFPFTAQVLHELSQGNGSSLASWSRSQRPGLGEPLSEQCLKDGPYSPACFQAPGSTDYFATEGIACSDGPGDRLSQTKEEYREYASSLIAQSSLIGASWASIQLPCTAWHARPHWRYEGNFQSKTTHPVLFAGNTIDPVTPLANAFRMAKGFEGAGVLHQDSEGHGTTAGLSLCSGKSIREYFQTGTLPGKEGGLDDWAGMGALCEQDRKPFDGYDGNGDVPELPEGETDKALWEAWVGLNRVWP